MPTCGHSFCAACYFQLAKDTDSFSCVALACGEKIQVHAVQRRRQCRNGKGQRYEEEAGCSEPKPTTTQNVQISASEIDAFFTTGTSGKSLVENNQLEANGYRQREADNSIRMVNMIIQVDLGT